MELNSLIAHFKGPLTGLIASWGASPADAVDLCMDSFAEAYLARERFRGDWNELASTGAWLRGIAHNLFQAHRRRETRPMEALGDRDFARDEDLGACERESRASRVRRAMDSLQAPYRTVLYMRYVDGSGLAEVAGLLGISEKAVEGRLYRARKALAVLLQDDKAMAAQAEQELDNE